MDFLQGFNKQQAIAVTHTEGNLQILAGAGTGKTKTLIGRVAYLIKYKHIDPTDILVLTFTNKAANEMKERAISFIGKEYINNRTFSTFHSWGLNILTIFSNNIRFQKYISKDFILLEEHQSLNIIKQLTMQKFMDIKNLTKEEYKEITSTNPLEFQNVKKFIDFLQAYTIIGDSREEISTIFRFLNKTKSSLLRSFLSLGHKIENIEEFYMDLFFQYRQYLNNKNYINYNDLINIPYRIILNEEDILSFFQKKYKYIMIDEFQDTNYAQFHLIKLISQDNLCVVGDDKQSIYGWRGAEVDLFFKFSKIFKDVKTIKLFINYRSDKNIIKASNLFADYLASNLNSHLQPFSKNKGLVTFHNSYSEVEEAEYISSIITPNSAILYRSHYLKNYLMKYFILNEIPYTVTDGVSFFELRVSKSLLSLLKYKETNEEQYFVSFLLFSDIFNKEQLKKAKLLSLSKNYQSLDRFLLENLNSLEDIAPKYANIIKNILINVKNLSKEEIITKINLKDLFKKRSSYTSSQEEIKKIDRKINNLELFQMLFNKKKYKGFKEFYKSWQNKIAKGETVHFMSIHASKGLEFDNVFIIGNNKAILPSKNSIMVNMLEEEKRLFYVAITRAKKKVYILSTSNLYRQQMKSSCFVEYLSEHL